jgi:hypothetical protein
VTAVDAVGIGPAGATNGAIGNGVTAFRTEVVLTSAMAQGGTIPTQPGAVFLSIGVGVTHIKRRARDQEDGPQMKILVGVGLFVIGIIVWIGSLVGALGILPPTVVSLGVTLGGALITGGIALMCLSNKPKRVPYFDKGG